MEARIANVPFVQVISCAIFILIVPLLWIAPILGVTQVTSYSAFINDFPLLNVITEEIAREQSQEYCNFTVQVSSRQIMWGTLNSQCNLVPPQGVVGMYIISKNVSSIPNNHEILITPINIAEQITMIYQQNGAYYVSNMYNIEMVSLFLFAAFTIFTGVFSIRPCLLSMRKKPEEIII